MKTFDLHHIAFDKVSLDFLDEVALHSLYTSALVLSFLKVARRCGVQQTPLLEVLIILTLGSAAGDIAFYDDVPMALILIVFTTLALLYRLVMWLMVYNKRLGDLLEGKPVVTIEDGELAWSKLNNSNITEFEFSVELRLRNVEQSGQMRLAALETSEQINIYFFKGDKVKPRLLTLSGGRTQRYKVIPKLADYARTRCSEIIHMDAGEKQLCPRCVSPEWTKASRTKWMT